MIVESRVAELNGINKPLVPFIACGDLSGWDSDRVYPLDLSKLDPTFTR